MIPRSRTFALNGLRAARTSSARIYAAGADPKFGRPPEPKLFRLEPAFPNPPPGSAATAEPRVFAPGLVDRLEAPLTRYRE